MMKLLKNIFLLMMLVSLFSSCEKSEDIIFKAEDASVAFNVYDPAAGYEGSAVKENATDPLRIPVTLSGLPGSAVSVSLTVSTEGISKPALEGVDYEISTKSLTFSEGYGTQYVEITPKDNDQYEGNKSFILTIVTPEGLKTNVKNTLEVSVVDDEHPLAKWIGTYAVDAKSYGDPGNWDEAWTVTTAPDPEDDTKLIITGVGSSDGTAVVAVVNTEDMTITIAGGQTIEGDIYGYGDIVVKYGLSDLSVNDDNLVGTIADDGSIHIDNWGHEMTGANAGYVWDVFNTYWTKK